jgi:hypothetical protein
LRTKQLSPAAAWFFMFSVGHFALWGKMTYKREEIRV